MTINLKIGDVVRIKAKSSGDDGSLGVVTNTENMFSDTTTVYTFFKPMRRVFANDINAQNFFKFTYLVGRSKSINIVLKNGNPLLIKEYLQKLFEVNKEEYQIKLKEYSSKLDLKRFDNADYRELCLPVGIPISNNDGTKYEIALSMSNNIQLMKAEDKVISSVNMYILLKEFSNDETISRIKILADIMKHEGEEQNAKEAAIRLLNINLNADEDVEIETVIKETNSSILSDALKRIL